MSGLEHRGSELPGEIYASTSSACLYGSVPTLIEHWGDEWRPGKAGPCGEASCVPQHVCARTWLHLSLHSAYTGRGYGVALVENWYLCVKTSLTLHSCGLLFPPLNDLTETLDTQP